MSEMGALFGRVLFNPPARNGHTLNLGDDGLAPLEEMEHPLVSMVVCLCDTLTDRISLNGDSRCPLAGVTRFELDMEVADGRFFYRGSHAAKLRERSR